MIKAIVTSLIHVYQDIASGMDAKDAIRKSALDGCTPLAQRIYRYVCEHPGCTIEQISDALDDDRRTLMNYTLVEFSKAGLIARQDTCVYEGRPRYIYFDVFEDAAVVQEMTTQRDTSEEAEVPMRDLLKRLPYPRDEWKTRHDVAHALYPLLVDLEASFAHGSTEFRDDILRRIRDMQEFCQFWGEIRVDSETALKREDES